MHASSMVGPPEEGEGTSNGSREDHSTSPESAGVEFPTATPLQVQRQIQYLAGHLQRLPAPYSKMDALRLTLVHFAVQTLDMYGIWDDHDDHHHGVGRRCPRWPDLHLDKPALIEWVYSLQIVTRRENDHHQDSPSTLFLSSAAEDSALAGFMGGTYLGRPFPPTKKGTGPATDSTSPTTTPGSSPGKYRHGHIAMTYSALCVLRTLGDDWSRVDRRGILQSLRSLQQPDGSFGHAAVGSEHDVRYLYCATCLAAMLNDWSTLDVDRAVQYIQSCRSWDGAMSLTPGGEGHGGSTFCAVASLCLMNRLDAVLDQDHWRSQLIYWCVTRQQQQPPPHQGGGLQGRPNKDPDSCYSYWIGATLRILQQDHLLDHEALRAFVYQCQTAVGGFGKYVNVQPDLLHAFYSTAYLSLSQRYLANPPPPDQTESGQPLAPSPAQLLKDINCTLGICQERAAALVPHCP